MSRPRKKIPDVYVRGRNPLNVCGNDRLAYAKAGAELSAYVNMLRGKRRKILGTAWRTGDTGASGLTDLFHFRFSTGPAVRAVVVEIICVPASNTAGGASIADAPYFAFDWSPDLDTYSPVEIVYVNRRSILTVTPSDHFVVTKRFEPVLPSTTYKLDIFANQYAKAHGVVIYEEADSFLPVKQAERDGNVGAGSLLAGAGLCTLTDASREFDSRSYAGCKITLSGWPTAANNGTFTITQVGPDWVRWHNSSAASEAADSDSAYEIDDLSARTPQAMRSIVDADIDDLNQGAYEMWQEGAGHLFSWSSRATRVTSSGAVFYVNVHDGSYTTYNSLAPGHWVWPKARGTYESALVPVVFWARVKKTSGVGGDCELIARNSSGTIATLTVSSSGYGTGLSTTGSLDATLDEDKIEIAAKGNGSTGLTVFSYGMYQQG